MTTPLAGHPNWDFPDGTSANVNGRHFLNQLEAQSDAMTPRCSIAQENGASLLYLLGDFGRIRIGGYRLAILCLAWSGGKRRGLTATGGNFKLRHYHHSALPHCVPVGALHRSKVTGVASFCGATVLRLQMQRTPATCNCPGSSFT
jgi:hypothetical protein